MDQLIKINKKYVTSFTLFNPFACRLRPLLTEIKRDRKVVAMATLDYIQHDTFEYKYNENYLTRYGWDWRLVFFETFFRDDQIGPQPTEARL